MFALTQKQCEIRDFASRDLLILAPAGCGKTEALALRVQGILKRGDVAAPQKILAVTFSNRARDNLKERLKSYLSPMLMRDRITIVNFHGLSARLIRAHANVIGFSTDLILPDGDWVKERLRKLELPWKEQEFVMKTLRVIKQNPLDDDQVEAELSRIGNITALNVEQIRKSEKRLTYDDLPRLAELILQYDAIADLYAVHFGAVVVDEYQDLTLQQLRIINRIGYKRTTYAGDLSQGIYGFAGAQPRMIDQSIRNECASVIELSESHRSSPAVLEMINSLTPLTSGQMLTAADPRSWPSGGLAGSVAHKTAELEANWVVKTTRNILEKVPEQRIGILARTASRRRFVDEAFAATDIPYFRWDDGVLDTDTAKLLKAMLARLEVTSYIAASDKTVFLRDAVDFESITEVDVRKSVAEALGWIQDLLSESVSPQEIRSRIQIGNSSTLTTSSGAHLLSGHIGKGQQFDWVFVIGVEEDFIPFFMAESDDEISEEARVLSVMISRARHGVILSRAESVLTNNGSPRRRKPSRFLRLISAIKPLNFFDIAEWFDVADWSGIARR